MQGGFEFLQCFPTKILIMFRTLSERSCNSIFTLLSSKLSVDDENICVVTDNGDLCGGDRGAGLVVPDFDNG